MGVRCQHRAAWFGDRYHKSIACGSPAGLGSEMCRSLSQSLGNIFDNLTCLQHPVGQRVSSWVTVQSFNHHRGGHHRRPQTLGAECRNHGSSPGGTFREPGDSPRVEDQQSSRPLVRVCGRIDEQSPEPWRPLRVRVLPPRQCVRSDTARFRREAAAATRPGPLPEAAWTAPSRLP